MNKVAILWKFKLFDVALIWLRIRNLRPRISCIEPSLFIFDAYLLLAKISKKFASMFVWRFVCLSVCLFVCLCRDTGRSFWLSNTKLGPHMISVPSQTGIVFIGHRSNNIQCPAAKSCLVQRAYWRKKIERDGPPSHWIILFFISPERG